MILTISNIDRGSNQAIRLKLYDRPGIRVTSGSSTVRIPTVRIPELIQAAGLHYRQHPHTTQFCSLMRGFVLDVPVPTRFNLIDWQ